MDSFFEQLFLKLIGLELIVCACTKLESLKLQRSIQLTDKGMKLKNKRRIEIQNQKENRNETRI
jgi:hypothetical protein